MLDAAPIHVSSEAPDVAKFIGTVSAPRVITKIGRAIVDNELALAATARSLFGPN
jgi:hypothetical protein